ncbi:MAG TPA: hypothetical protein P5079_02120 [Elusimicrobiota bacterium]|nr:hypothetical protein [Elusimicrobiota bacterium]
MTPTSPQDEFVRFAGQLAESFSFNKSIGQIYGLLYLNPEPLSLDEISKRLLMSKGNASINLRVLEEWGAVRSVPIPGSRRDHYEANRNLKEVALRRLEEGLGRRISWAEKRLDDFLTRTKESPGSEMNAETKKQLQEIRVLLARGRKAMALLPKIGRFLT